MVCCRLSGSRKKPYGILAPVDRTVQVSIFKNRLSIFNCRCNMGLILAKSTISASLLSLAVARHCFSDFDVGLRDFKGV